MRKLFISYARQDNAAAKRLVNALQSVDITGWLDAADIAGGKSVASAVRSALRASNAVVVLVSPHAINSHWVQFEVGAAEAFGKPIIPVLISGSNIEEHLPDILKTRQVIDARKKAARQIAEEIERALGVEGVQ